MLTLRVLDDWHNSEISENHDWPMKNSRQSWTTCETWRRVNFISLGMILCACDFSSPKWSQSSCMFWISSWLRPSVKMGLGFFSNPPDRIPPCQARAYIRPSMSITTTNTQLIITTWNMLKATPTEILHDCTMMWDAAVNLEFCVLRLTSESDFKTKSV